MAKTTKQLAQELLTLKDKAESAKQEATRLEGQLNALYTRLHKEYDVETLQQGEELLKKMDSEAEEKNTRLEEGIKRLEGMMSQGTANGQ